MEGSRYLGDKLIKTSSGGDKEAKEISITLERDSYGNRWFISRTHSFVDKAQKVKPAAIVVSPEGETLIKKNPHLLTSVDTLLQKAHYLSEQTTDSRMLIKNHKAGRQSMTRRLMLRQKYPNDDNSTEVILKVPRGNSKSTQPYINEMRQTQIMTASLQQELQEAKIELPTFYFASPYVSATKFVEGEEPQIEEVLKRTGRLYKRVKEFIGDQGDDPLWKNIHPDNKSWGTQKYQTKNYILRQDGTLVWIDPFTYKEHTPFLDRIERVIIDFRKALRLE